VSEPVVDHLIIGSGPAAAAAALAITSGSSASVTVIDVGESLEPERREALEQAAQTAPLEWPKATLDYLAAQPVAQMPGELPEKRLYGSDFPFRDVGQLDGLHVSKGGNSKIISGAYGGFSSSWGAQVLPFTARTFDGWPVSLAEMGPHYEAVLAHVPLAAAHDDYTTLFPLFTHPAPLPPLAEQGADVLRRYAANRHAMQRRGVTMGEARLAMRARDCIACGLCLTGCPYGLIYSASQTFDELVHAGRLSYRPGLLAFRVGEDADGCFTLAKELRSGRVHRLRSRKVYVACGGLGSTRLVQASGRPDVREIEMQEAVQFVLPMLSSKAHRDPRTYSTFTLNQYSMLVEYGRPGLDLAQIHLYPYNPAFSDELPKAVKLSAGLTTAVLRRATAALGYLPSWHSPGLRVGFTPVTADDELPAVSLSSVSRPDFRRQLVKVLSRMFQVAKRLDLYPVLPAVRVSGPGKSYHYGGSFPHVQHARRGRCETDRQGRLAEWRNIHLLDGSVFPSVAATTFTLTVMANSHRIVSEALLESHEVRTA